VDTLAVDCIRTGNCDQYSIITPCRAVVCCAKLLPRYSMSYEWYQTLFTWYQCFHAVRYWQLPYLPPIIYVATASVRLTTLGITQVQSWWSRAGRSLVAPVANYYFGLSCHEPVVTWLGSIRNRHDVTCYGGLSIWLVHPGLGEDVLQSIKPYKYQSKVCKRSTAIVIIAIIIDHRITQAFGQRQTGTLNDYQASKRPIRLK
jgi:hypothetical protein